MDMRSARQAQGYTLEALASRIVTTKGYLSELENGKKRASLQMALKLQRELPGLCLESLLKGPDEGEVAS